MSEPATTNRSADREFSLIDAARLGILSGLAAHLPWLLISRIDGLRTFAVVMTSVFLVFDPWLTIPLAHRLRACPQRSRNELIWRGAASGIVAGSTSAIVIVAWERWRTGGWLGGVDLAGHAVYPVLALVYAGITALVVAWLRARRQEGP